MKQMRFAKYQVNGNDFIVTFDQVSQDDIRLLANRKFGVGCDQFIAISNAGNSSYKISIWNQDGSHAKMCGNGSCAAVSYIATFLGQDTLRCYLEIDNKVYKATAQDRSVSVEFLLPKLIFDSLEYKVISTGNFHLIYACDIECANDKLATDLQNKHPDSNIHFVKRLSDNMVRLRTFERGVGWTKACGSGAVAVAFSFGEGGDFKIVHDGGTSDVLITEKSAILRTIPVAVFKGETM